MTTRRANPNAPLSQERYMSHADYAEARGISGNIVAAKAALIPCEKTRQLLFFIQGLSLRQAGLKRLVTELLEKFPERIGTHTMHRLGIKPGRHFSEQRAAFTIGREMTRYWSGPFDTERHYESSCDKLLEKCHTTAVNELDEYLCELCIDPDKKLTLPGERPDHIVGPGVPYFHDLMGALREYQALYAQSARESLADTAVAREVFTRLDRALRHKKMVVLEGEPGIGKTKAVETWAQMHLGEARLVNLSGCVNKTSIFRKIAQAAGLPSTYAVTVTDMQSRVEDFFKRSGLMLIFDESHFLFSQSARFNTRPEMLDWVDTALCNEGVPVALCSTPQFRRRLHQAEKQTIWQSDQFRRRVKDYVPLPAVPQKEDLEAVARKLLPGAGKEAIRLVVVYATTSKWPMTAIANAVEDAGDFAADEAREKIEFADLARAINEFRLPSEQAQTTAFAEPAKAPGGRGRSKAAPPQQPDGGTPAATPREVRPALATDVSRSNQPALQE